MTFCRKKMHLARTRKPWITGKMEIFEAWLLFLDGIDGGVP